MASEKLNQIATLIYEKTKSGEIHWERTSDKRSFQTSFPNYAIVIGPIAAMPNLGLHNEEGDLIEEIHWLLSPGPLQVQLVELYEIARRQALGAEQAVDDLLKMLRESTAIEKKQRTHR